MLAANHQSWIDSAILAAAVYRHLTKPLKFIAQSTKWNVFGALPIQKQDKAQVIDVALDYMTGGYPIVIFPEGNSNKNPELRTGKTGAARLALRSGLPVVPVGISGTRGVKAWRAIVWFFSLVYPCHVEIGQPISFPKAELHDAESALLNDTTTTIMTRISDLSGKPMPGQGLALGHRGFWWYFLWRFFRPFVQWRIRVKGAEYLPRSGPFIIVGNHTSYFDAPAVAMATFHISGLQPMFPTKQSVAAGIGRIVGQGGLNALGMLPLNNADKSRVLEPAIHFLQHGGVIGIFPEGTRNKPKINPKWETEMLKGKTGAARLVIATKAQVIPAAITGPRGLGIVESVIKGLLPWYFFRVTFGPPVQFDAVPASLESATKDDLDRLTRQLMRPVASLAGYTYPH